MPEYSSRSIVVGFGSDTALALASEVLSAISGTALPDAVCVDRAGMAGGIAGAAVLDIGTGLGVEQAMAILRNLPGITYAEPDYRFSIAATPDDPFYANGSLWGMYGDQSAPANRFGSQAGEAWTRDVTGTMHTVVGVIDTGVDYTHPDLYLNIWLNPGEVSTLSFRANLVDADADGLITFRDLDARDGTNQLVNGAYVSDINGNGRIDAGDLLADNRWANGVDNDGNGKVDDLIGWDFVNNDNNPYDDNSHGTHVSGIIGAQGGNGIGVAGVNWRTQIMAVKFLDANGAGNGSDAIQALNYYTQESLAGDGLTYVGTNNSYAGGGYMQSFADAILATARAGNVFVAAAGNEANNNDLRATYPANYTTQATLGWEAVVSVAALTSLGALASFSNYGNASVDLAAPGAGIWSTVPGGYASYSGTSMAAPHVLGALALLASQDIYDTPQQLVSQLRSAVMPISSLGAVTAWDGALDVGVMIQSLSAAPVVTAFMPADGAVGFDPGSDIQVAFSKAIARGAGFIDLRLGSATGTLVERFDAAISDRLSISGSSLVINPTADLAANTRYFLVFAAGSVTDTLGTPYAGSNTYDFTTANLIIGTDAANTLAGTAGVDVIRGLGGADKLTGDAGKDKMDGGQDGDIYFIASAAHHPDAEIADTGTSGVDEVRFTATTAGTLMLFAGDTGLERAVIGTGTSTAAVTTGMTANNIDASYLLSAIAIVGNAGNNVLTGGAGNDTLTGNAGIDTFNVTAGSDTVSDLGVGGADVLNVSAGAAVNAIAAAAWTASSGTVNKGTAQITTSGLAVNLAAVTSTAAGNNGFAVLNSGTAASLTGSALDDRLTGGNGSDVLTGGPGLDILDGAGGSDLYVIASNTQHTGAEIADSGASGIDEVRFTTSTASTLTLYAGDVGLERAVIGLGTSGSAITSGTTAINIDASALGYGITLVGNAGNNALTGGAGNDSLQGGLGNDLLNGGDGFDTADYSTATVGIRVNLGITSAQNTVGAGTDTLISIEGINGSTLADTIMGDGQANTLAGGAGNDTISGGDGDDVLLGGVGNDILTGGAGNDRFTFDRTPNASSNRDTITDFQPGVDRLDFSQAVFSGLASLPQGQIGADQFWSGAGVVAAHDASDRLIYNTTSGLLYYDADGTGAAAAVQVVLLGSTTHPALTYSDIWIIA